VPEYTRPATWDDVKKLAALLNEAGVEYALVGGYAIAAHGFNRFSEDIDILVNPAAENSRRWIVALSELPDHAARELPLLNLEGLLITKQGTRPKDQMDAALLSQALAALKNRQK
jgi:nucleotidyltransferase AbiEii toxin of type IV toxin-antitoxin system